MLKQNKALIISIAIILFAPAFLTKPANAQTNIQMRERDRDSARDNRRDWNRESRPLPVRDRQREDRRSWNRNNERPVRVVRLRNGDVRLPNGEIVPARRLVRVRDGYYRLPSGVVVQINL